MNTFTLLNLVLNPEKAGESDLEALQELIQEYPYFQAAHLLVAKITGNSEHIKRAAAYTSEREVLMQVINSDFNTEVNLPNIDNLEIGQDDLSIFDKLEKDDEVSLGEDDDFNDSFGDFDFEDKEEASADDASEDIPLVLDVEPPTEEEVEDTGLEEVKEVVDIGDLEEEVPEIVIDDLDDSEEVTETADDIEELTEEVPDVDLTAFEEEPDLVEEEEDTDLMDELAELRKLQAEMEKNRKDAEEAMQKEEDREKMTNSTVADSETSDFSEPNYEYPEYDIADTVKETADEEKEELAEKNEETVEKEEETAATEVFEEAETATETVPSDDLSFFEKEEIEPKQPEEVVEEETIEEVLEIEEEESTPKSKIHSDIFNFGDDSLFDLDALLAEESQQIDAVKELESRPEVKNTTTTSRSVDQLHEKQSSLINDFIEKSPSIKIPKDSFDNTIQDDEDLTSESLDIPSNLASENLATIYVKQGKYDKARNIYQQLMLKYPQKKAYFADLISNLEDK